MDAIVKNAIYTMQHHHISSHTIVPCVLSCKNGGVLQSATCTCDCSKSVLYGGQDCTCKEISPDMFMCWLYSFNVYSMHVNAKMEVSAVDQYVPVHLGTLEHCVRLHVQQAVQLVIM